MKAKDFYKPPPVWNKQPAVFIVGGGPSINGTNLDLIKKYKVIGINNAYKMGGWVDICWFGD